MARTFRGNIKFGSLYSKVIVSGIILVTFILVCMNLVVNNTMTEIEERLIAERLKTDKSYLEDMIKYNASYYDWEVRDGAIYFGDVLIGDGTEENANLKPFLYIEENTGTLSYVFIKKSETDEHFLAALKEDRDYEIAPYLRAAGSTRDSEKKSILGTYISKDVAEGIEKQGFFSGEANVAGDKIFCFYESIKDKDGNIIGAMVVGRSIVELKKEISESVARVSITMVFFMLGVCVIVVILVKRWLGAMSKVNFYLRQIEAGVIPEEELKVDAKGEIGLIVESVNRMVAYLRENAMLQTKSKVDELTGLPNRMAYNEYTVGLSEYLAKNPRGLAVEILDIDYFKQYNDNYGHQMGDVCIKFIAEEIKRVMAENPKIYAARYGGDEFVLIYPGFLQSEVESFVRSLKKNIQSRAFEHRFSKVSDVVTITQGICFDIFAKDSNIDEFLKRADEALYEVKKVTRNSYKFCGLERL